MNAAAYIRAALENEEEALRNAQAGGRHIAAFRAAAALGNLVGGGDLDQELAQQRLVAAAVRTGLSEAEAHATIRSGLQKGVQTPRNAPSTALSFQMHGDLAVGRARQGASHGAAGPPLAEMTELWKRSQPVTLDREITTWLGKGRGLDPEAVELWDLARALPRGTKLPRWARSRLGGFWTNSGHRLLFRTWDQHGEFGGVRARSVSGQTSTIKSLSPGGLSTVGLVLADPLGVQLLASGPPAWWSPREIVIVEGEPDWLTWAVRQSETREQGPAIFGVVAGSWTPEIATRIPDGARIALRVHTDTAGEGYAASIANALRERCDVHRLTAGTGR